MSLESLFELVTFFIKYEFNFNEKFLIKLFLRV